jgi:ankyrin repeat protein
MNWISAFMTFWFVFAPPPAQPDELMKAVRTGDVDKVKTLLTRGVPVTTPDSDGRTALHEAAAKGNVELFRMLVSAGGDLRAQDNHGVTPESIVFRTSDNNVRNEMIRSFPKGSTPRLEDGPWTLTSAISHRQPNVIEMLLKLGVKPDLADLNGDYPIHLAAQKGDLQIVQLLLSHGASASIQSRTGSFPIHTAALSGNTDIVQLLLDKGAEIDCRVLKTGETPLYYASSFGRTKTVELLLERGANPDIPDAKGLTPMAAAQKAGQTEVVSLLRTKIRHN